MKHIYLFFILCCSLTSYSQIGIGEINPTAALEIKTQPSHIPALSLVPQAQPMGSDTGQLAVIGDQLYMYDAAPDRRKWLSIEQTTLEYGRLGNNTDSEEVEYGGDVQGLGPKMPFDGTIVGIAMQATRDDLTTNIELYINDIAVPNDILNTNKDGVFNLDPTTRSYVNNNYAVDFQAGDAFTFEINGVLDVIENLTIVLYVKWRKENG